MKKLFLFIGIFFLVLSCSVDEECNPIPQFSSIEAEPLNDTSINVKALITPPSCEDSFTSQGIVYSTSTLPKITDSKFESSNGNLNKTFEGLNQKTVYYFRAFFENVTGVYYSEEVTSSTMVGEVEFSKTFISKVTPITAKVNFNIQSSGGGNISESGVVYSTSSNPSIDNVKISSNGSSGSFDLIDLEPNTKYYLKPYGNNEAGLFYGEETSFTTLDGIVDMKISLHKIKKKSLNYSILVADDGGYGGLITSKGFYFSNTNSLQTNQKYVLSSGLINSLNTDTGYYIFPFYAINNGEEIILDSIYFKTAPDDIKVEIRRFDQLLELPSTGSATGDYYQRTGTDADVWIDTDLKYIEKATLYISERNFQNNSWFAGWIFWQYGTIYSSLSQTKFVEENGETLVLNIGKGGSSNTRIYINDGDGKFDVTYTIRVELTDHSGNTYYSDIIELDIPDFNPSN